MKFSSRTNWSTEDNELSRSLALLKQDNIPVLDLTVSNPTQTGFQYLNEDLLRAFHSSENLSYTPDPHGLIAAREMISAYYQRKGIQVPPQHIFVTANTSEAYSFIFRLLFEGSDFLLAPQPSYPLMDYLTALHDVPVKRYTLEAGQSWNLQLAGHYEETDENPKAILTVNPNNPTGNYLHVPELAELNLFCKSRDAAIISDEVFFDYPIDKIPDNAVSCARNGHNLTFTLSGISKILGLPQMKLSWIAVSGPDAVVRDAVRRLEVISDTYLSVSTPAQHALQAWFEKEKSIQTEILQRIRANYQTLRNLFGQGGSVRSFPVQGGWHAPLQLPSQHTDEEWACQILKKEHVLTHPGYLFDFPQGSFLVVSLIAPEKTFREGLERIKRQAAS